MLLDTVAFIVCAGVGLDVGDEAIPYVAGGAKAMRQRR